MTSVAERRVGNQIYNFLRETFFHENTIIVSLNGEKIKPQVYSFHLCVYQDQ